MDTRKWGPSGWIFLHTISFSYPNKPNSKDKINNLLFFNTIQDILPCKYCRESFKQFNQKLPLINHLDNTHQLSKWLYNIHNMVNNKLRNQGLLKNNNPTYSEIKNKYSNHYSNFIPWDFLYCIIFNFPTLKNINATIIQSYFTFFNLLTILIPDNNIKQLYLLAYQKYNIKCYLNNRIKLKQWLFKINCFINKDLCRKNKKYKDICQRYDSYRSGCSKKNFKGITCRKSNKYTKKSKQ